MSEVLAEKRKIVPKESLELSNELVLLADRCLELSLHDQATELLREGVQGRISTNRWMLRKW